MFSEVLCPIHTIFLSIYFSFRVFTRKWICYTIISILLDTRAVGERWRLFQLSMLNERFHRAQPFADGVEINSGSTWQIMMSCRMWIIEDETISCDCSVLLIWCINQWGNWWNIPPLFPCKCYSIHNLRQSCDITREHLKISMISSTSCFNLID